MVEEVTRYIRTTVERELWARAAGRCQFSGCNKFLYKSSVTQETVNIAQKAHIYSFSKKGPRGWGILSKTKHKLNDISNLMLMCHSCHQKIDQDNGGTRYTATLLNSWKAQHEQRVEIVTGIAPDKKSHVVLYGANIGSEKSSIEYHTCVQAMFPHWYPSDERPIQISTKSELKDSSPQYWQAEELHLLKAFERKILPVIEDDPCKHLSLFTLAPQPLLIELGALLTDKMSVESYQLHREPKSWQWQDCQDNFDYIVHKPEYTKGAVALIVSLSDYVSKKRITRVLGDDAAIWEITIENPHNDFMQSRQQLSLFRQRLRGLIVDIKQQHGEITPLHIFPVMPVSCAIEFGRARMPKADMPWLVYDHDMETQEFINAIELKGDLHARQSK
ncbi:SAVED domain-containing protein [Kiloniella majae]|uniref:SAVED domain-containing protein n=1 Tax=Kiloniella majae TaxID=1938558 RepID=UPI000A2783D3|nr:SAVED domain-containing protein [Kiloniella majae]